MDADGVRSGEGVRAGEPTMPSEHGEVTFAPVSGSAFRTDGSGAVVDPSWRDVDQGNLGDCWLMAASAAIAHQDPEYIRGRVTPNANGTFDVRLGSGTETVSAEFPDPSRRLGADPTPNGQSDTLWVALVERAYAQRMGNSYSALDGGDPARALEMLTGRPTTTTTIATGTDSDTLWNQITAGRAGDHAMVLSTRNSNSVPSPLQSNHAYAVLDAYERDGQQYVSLYNPWGMNDGGNSENSRVHEVRIEDLPAHFSALDVSGG